MMEALLIRIDTLRDRKQYLSILKAWLAELKIAHGRLITMGEFHLLFIVAAGAQIDKLLEFYATKEIDTNVKDELCVDKFIDIVGRKAVEASGCKGFLDMNILNKGLLEKVLVHEWHGEKEWLDSALETPRTRALLAWREEAKASRRDRRKKSAQDRDATKLLKKQQAEAEAAAKAAADALKKEMGSDDDDDDESLKEDGEESDGDEIELESGGADVKVEQNEAEQASDEEFIQVPAAKPQSQRPQNKQQKHLQAKTTAPAPHGNASTKPKHQQQSQKQNQQKHGHQQQQQKKKRPNSQEWKQKSKQQKRTN